MQSQISTDAKQHPGVLQIGATLVAFVRKEEKWVSEFIPKEVADLFRGTTGYEVKDFTESEAKKAVADEAVLKADAEKDARTVLAEAGNGNAKDAEKDAEAGLKSLVGETLSDGKVITADGKGEVAVVKAEEKDAPVTEAPAKETEAPAPASQSGANTQPETPPASVNEMSAKGDVVTQKAKASRAGQKVNGTPSASTPNTPNTANTEGPAAALIANNATDGQPVMSPPVHETGGDGGTSWGPEDGNPQDALPGTVDTDAVKTEQEKTKKGENLAPPKDGPQGVGSTKP